MFGISPQTRFLDLSPSHITASSSNAAVLQTQSAPAHVMCFKLNSYVAGAQQQQGWALLFWQKKNQEVRWHEGQ